MKDRCLNPRNHAYERYGARGITVCERWLTFENFYNDMGKAPTPNHTLERLENDKSYNKENCIWATPKEQNLNKRTTPYLTINGVTKKKADWLKEYGILNASFNSRTKRQGMTVTEALTTPIKDTKQNLVSYRRKNKSMPND